MEKLKKTGIGLSILIIGVGLLLIWPITYAISILGMFWLAYEGWKSKRFYQKRNEIG